MGASFPTYRTLRVPPMFNKLGKDIDNNFLFGWLILSGLLYAILIPFNLYILVLPLAVSVVSIDSILSEDLTYKRESFWLYLSVQTLSIALFPFNTPREYINLLFICLYSKFSIASFLAYALFYKHLQAARLHQVVSTNGG